MKVFKTTEEEIQTFTNEELRLWNKGYLAAIEGLLEQITDDKIRVMTKIMEVNTSDGKALSKEKLVKSLEARLGVLDAYEVHYRTRVQQLERDTE